MFVGATHTYGGTQGPWGGLVSYIAQNRQLQPYTKLTRTLHQTYGSKAYKPYTKLTPTLQLYGYTVLYKLLCETLHQTYAKLTWNLRQQALRLSEYCYILLQNLHETYGSQLLTKS